MSIKDLADQSIRVPVSDQQVGDGLPRIWWRYGTPPATAGFFYTPADQWHGDLPAPWAEAEVFSGERGWVTRALELCPVLRRAQPYRKASQGGRIWRDYAPRWEPGMQIHSEVLVLIRGIDEPAVWSYHGATGAVVERRPDGVWAVAKVRLADEASRQLRRHIGLSAFWLPLGPVMDPRGKPVFARLEQGAQLNHVALRLPDVTDDELLDRQYVGHEILERVIDLQAEYADWPKQRRGGDQPAAAAADDVAAQAGDDLF